jgi:hypothetical protein
MIHVELTWIGVEQPRIGIVPGAGEDAAVARIHEGNRRQRLLDQDLLSRVLTIPVGVDPMLPVVAAVGGDG